MYKLFFKRLLDIVLSLLGIILLALPMLIIAAMIKATSPGPVMFKQKRVGINKTYFSLYKFRTMRIDTPHDTPTHMLINPGMYITGIGAFLRKTSADELPQLFNILVGNMSVVGPRPALWNQDDLIAERDKYGANDIRPGLTGWAQINGRDALELVDKARYDGFYTANLTFGMDCRCFFGTVKSVLKRDGVVEGGTGELSKAKQENQEILK